MVIAKGMCPAHIQMYLYASNINLCISQWEGIPSRDRRPSDKVVAQHIFISPPCRSLGLYQSGPGESERESAKKKADKEQCHAIRKKKAE